MRIIKDLIEYLSKYDENTEICSGYIDGKGWSHMELIVKETHPIGDRDTEEELMIWIGCEF